MGIFKSKREKEIERKIRAKKAKITLQNYIVNLERLQKRIFSLGKEAKKLGDDKLARRQAVKFLALEGRVNQAKKLLLLMEEAEAEKELVHVSSSFIAFTKDIVDSIAEGPDASKIAEIQGEFEKAMNKAEDLEEVLSVVVDTANENILSSGDFDEEKIGSIMKILDSEAGLEENDIDLVIEKRIKEIDDAMKR